MVSSSRTQSYSLSRSDRPGLLDDPRHHPPLAAAERTRWHEGDAVADLRFVLLIVRHELRRQPLLFAVHPVAHLTLDRHGDALVHLVADDDAHNLCSRHTPSP